MIVINLSTCSPSFVTAYRHITAGKRAKRAEWPDGQFLQLHPHNHDAIAVYRDNTFSAPFWRPTGSDQDATDWILLESTSINVA